MNDCKLILAAIYEDEDNEFYMRLVYTFTDGYGTHELTFPKVELPFNRINIPDMKMGGPFLYENLRICSKKEMRLLEGSVSWSAESRYFFDRIVEPKVHQMTIEQIEEELGYKVEIVT